MNKRPSNIIAAGLAIAAAAALGVLGARGGEPLCWERTPNRPAPAQFDTFHGETLDFRCTFTGFGELPFGDGAEGLRRAEPANQDGLRGAEAANQDGDVRLWYQTNGMGTAWWSVPATVTSNVLAAAWGPSCDPGAERVSFFFGAPSNAYAAAMVRFRNSPGAAPNVLPPPSVLDWVAELAAATNALAQEIAQMIQPADLTPATNYVDAATNAAMRQTELVLQDAGAAATNYTDAAVSALSNAIPGMVTNEVVTAWSDIWDLVVDEKIAVSDYEYVRLDEMLWYWNDDEYPEDGGYWQSVIRWRYKGEVYEDGQEEEFIRAYDSETKDGLLEVTETITGVGLRRRPAETRNALGLARRTDIAPSVSNTVTKAYVEDLGIESGIQVETDPVWTEEKGGYATTGTVARVAGAVGTIWSYVYGDSVWIAVTNYMRTVGGVSPSFQLWEVRAGVTNLMYWSKEEITNVTHDLIHDCKTNLEATVRNAVAEMPDKAWSKYQSATGNEAPEGVTIVSTPTIQLTGGGEWYRYIDVASNSVWFLKSNGLHTFGGDTDGYFRILDDEGNATFEVRKTDSYIVDAVASSIHFDEDGNFCVSFQSNVQPVIYTAPTLDHPNFLPEGEDPNVTVTWTQSGGVYTATLEQAVEGPSLFAYAKVEEQGETVIRNTVPTDLQGGIIVNGVKYNVGTATISGHTVLTLTPRN